MTKTLSVLRRDGGWQTAALDDVISRLERRRLRAPAFASDRMAALARIGDALARDPALSEAPALRRFGFALRTAGVADLERRFRSGLPAECRAFGRGIAFHLPPTNVDTLFLYSWAMGFLTGNAGITRLPTSFAPAIQRAVGIVLEEQGEEEADLFVTYPADETINRALSASADVRLVWGGDAKAALFHAYPLRLGGKSLVFPDRRSFAVLGGDALSALDRDGRLALARGMGGDVFLFDQMACSSPRILYVLGDEVRHGEAVGSFLDDLGRAGDERGPPTPALAVAKFAHGCSLAAAGQAGRVRRVSPTLTVIHLDDPVASPQDWTGGGLLYLRFVSSLEEIAPLIGDADQTLTWFGLTAPQLDAFVALAGPRGLARVVPVGQALDFDVVWDGYDLPREMVRLINVRTVRPAVRDS